MTGGRNLIQSIYDVIHWIESIYMAIFVVYPHVGYVLCTFPSTSPPGQQIPKAWRNNVFLQSNKYCLFSSAESAWTRAPPPTTPPQPVSKCLSWTNISINNSYAIKRLINLFYNLFFSLSLLQSITLTSGTTQNMKTINSSSIRVRISRWFSSSADAREGGCGGLVSINYPWLS